MKSETHHPRRSNEPAHPSMTTLTERRRSVAFIEKDGESWACFLVTFVEDGGLWHGYFSFRPGHGEDEVRTAACGGSAIVPDALRHTGGLLGPGDVKGRALVFAQAPIFVRERVDTEVVERALGLVAYGVVFCSHWATSSAW